jgi:hypothetical protein
VPITNLPVEVFDAWSIVAMNSRQYALWAQAKMDYLFVVRIVGDFCNLEQEIGMNLNAQLLFMPN